MDELKAQRGKTNDCGNQPQTFGNDFEQDPNFCTQFENQNAFGDDFENQSPVAGVDFGNQVPNFCDNFENQASTFGDEFGGQNDWEEMGFGDEEFTSSADMILQSEAPPDGFVDYPEDFPPPCDVFGPGFDWSVANQTEPSWPHSFPGRPLGGHSMSDNDNIALDCLDDSKDIEAVSYPPNAAKLNHLRKKLSEICNNQYREVIKMLQDDLTKDQNKISSLLNRVDSSPVYDANVTLAPIPRVPAMSPPAMSPATCKSANTTDDSSFESKGSPRYRDLLHDKNIDNLTSLSLLANHQEKYDLNESFNRKFRRQRCPKSNESLLEGITPLEDYESDGLETSERSVNTSSRCPSSEDAECKEVIARQSPLNMCNISQRLSQVTSNHYQILTKLLDEKSDKEKELIIREVWRTKKESFYDGNKFSKTKSLALLQALRIGS